MHAQNGADLSVHHVNLQIARIERRVVGQAKAALPFRLVAQQRDVLPGQLAHSLIVQVERAVPEQHGHLAARLEMQPGALLRGHAVRRDQRQIHAAAQVQAAQIDTYRLIARAGRRQSLLLRTRRAQRQHQRNHQRQAAANGPSFAKHDKAASFDNRTNGFAHKTRSSALCLQVNPYGCTAQRYGTMPRGKWQAAHACARASYPENRVRRQPPFGPERR